MGKVNVVSNSGVGAVQVFRQFGRSIIAVFLCLALLGMNANGKESEAEAVLKTLYGDLLDTLDARRADILQDSQVLDDIAAEIVLPYVDFERMAKVVMGKNWRKLSDTQREDYVSFIKNKISTAMVKLYDPNKTLTMDFLRSRTSPKGDKAVVQTRWQAGENAQVYSVDYRMRLRKQKWQVYDVSVDGISVLQSYKTAVADAIEKEGLDQYLASLATESTTQRKPVVAETSVAETPAVEEAAPVAASSVESNDVASDSAVVASAPVVEESTESSAGATQEPPHILDFAELDK